MSCGKARCAMACEPTQASSLPSRPACNQTQEGSGMLQIAGGGLPWTAIPAGPWKHTTKPCAQGLWTSPTGETVVSGRTLAANSPSTFPDGSKSLHRLRVGGFRGRHGIEGACQLGMAELMVGWRHITSFPRHPAHHVSQMFWAASKLAPVSSLRAHHTMKCQLPAVGPAYQEDPGHCATAQPIWVVDSHTIWEKCPESAWKPGLA